MKKPSQVKLKHFIRNEKRRAKIQGGISKTQNFAEILVAAVESRDLAQLKQVVESLSPAHRALFEKHLEAETVAYAHDHAQGHTGTNAEFEIIVLALSRLHDGLHNKSLLAGARFLNEQQEVFGGAI